MFIGDALNSLLSLPIDAPELVDELSVLPTAPNSLMLLTFVMLLTLCCCCSILMLLNLNIDALNSLLSFHLDASNSPGL